MLRSAKDLLFRNYFLKQRVINLLIEALVAKDRLELHELDVLPYALL